MQATALSEESLIFGAVSAFHMIGTHMGSPLADRAQPAAKHCNFQPLSVVWLDNLGQLAVIRILITDNPLLLSISRRRSFRGLNRRDL